jgi:hypothetical protein
MKRRITISLEAELERRIRNKQANLLLKSNHSVSFSEMLNRILQEALKREGLENESESNMSSEQSTLMEQTQPNEEDKMMNSVHRKRQTKGTNVEIESKLNSVYNRLV